MKKVQSRFKATICLMKSPQGFNYSAAAVNFPSGSFINYNLVWTLESIQTPYIYAKNHQDSLTSLKTKSSISFQNQAFQVHPAGLEPATC